MCLSLFLTETPLMTVKKEVEFHKDKKNSGENCNNKDSRKGNNTEERWQQTFGKWKINGGFIIAKKIEYQTLQWKVIRSKPIDIISPIKT